MLQLHRVAEWIGERGGLMRRFRSGICKLADVTSAVALLDDASEVVIHVRQRNSTKRIGGCGQSTIRVIGVPRGGSDRIGHGCQVAVFRIAVVTLAAGAISHIDHAVPIVVERQRASDTVHHTHYMLLVVAFEPYLALVASVDRLQATVSVEVVERYRLYVYV